MTESKTQLTVPSVQALSGKMEKVKKISQLFKNPPQPHMCVQDFICGSSDPCFINVLSWTKLSTPSHPQDPIQLYGGMKILHHSINALQLAVSGYNLSRNTSKRPAVFAVMANPEVLKASGRKCTNLKDRDDFIDLMLDFVEAMNPGLKFQRRFAVLCDRDLAGELKDIWFNIQNKRERDKASQSCHGGDLFPFNRHNNVTIRISEELTRSMAELTFKDLCLSVDSLNTVVTNPETDYSNRWIFCRQLCDATFNHEVAEVEEIIPWNSSDSASQDCQPQPMCPDSDNRTSISIHPNDEMIFSDCHSEGNSNQFTDKNQPSRMITHRTIASEDCCPQPLPYRSNSCSCVQSNDNLINEHSMVPYDDEESSELPCGTQQVGMLENPQLFTSSSDAVSHWNTNNSDHNYPKRALEASDGDVSKNLKNSSSIQSSVEIGPVFHVDDIQGDKKNKIEISRIICNSEECEEIPNNNEIKSGDEIPDVENNWRESDKLPNEVVTTCVSVTRSNVVQVNANSDCSNSGEISSVVSESTPTNFEVTNLIQQNPVYDTAPLQEDVKIQSVYEDGTHISTMNENTFQSGSVVSIFSDMSCTVSRSTINDCILSAHTVPVEESSKSVEILVPHRVVNSLDLSVDLLENRNRRQTMSNDSFPPTDMQTHFHASLNSSIPLNECVATTNKNYGTGQEEAVVLDTSTVASESEVKHNDSMPFLATVRTPYNFDVHSFEQLGNRFREDPNQLLAFCTVMSSTSVPSSSQQLPLIDRMKRAHFKKYVHGNKWKPSRKSSPHYQSKQGRLLGISNPTVISKNSKQNVLHSLAEPLLELKELLKRNCSSMTSNSFSNKIAVPLGCYSYPSCQSLISKNHRRDDCNVSVHSVWQHVTNSAKPESLDRKTKTDEMLHKLDGDGTLPSSKDNSEINLSSDSLENKSEVQDVCGVDFARSSGKQLYKNTGNKVNTLYHDLVTTLHNIGSQDSEARKFTGDNGMKTSNVDIPNSPSSSNSGTEIQKCNKDTAITLVDESLEKSNILPMSHKMECIDDSDSETNRQSMKKVENSGTQYNSLNVEFQPSSDIVTTVDETVDNRLMSLKECTFLTGILPNTVLVNGEDLCSSVSLGEYVAKEILVQENNCPHLKKSCELHQECASEMTNTEFSENISTSVAGTILCPARKSDLESANNNCDKDESLIKHVDQVVSKECLDTRDIG